MPRAAALPPLKEMHLGNTAREARPGGVGVTNAYDGYGRLTQYTRGTEALSFQYNGRDDRVAMTSASAGVRRYVYDPAGRVIGEYGLSAADVKAEFIWLSPEVANDNAFGGDDGIGGYAPLAVATPDSSGSVQLNWVHPNHLGVPLVTTDASGNPATTPNDYLAPGFPGQARVLADLYYNRYRDYDPTTGRYIQADPIGLAGGGNPYLYAGGNPMGRVDPDGRYWWLIGGAIAGGGFELGGQAFGNWMAGRDVFDPDCYDWAAVGRGALYGAALGGAGRFASLRFAAAETAAPKFVPNPYGKLGGPEHQALVADITADIRLRRLLPEAEFRIPTPGGAKSARFVDVVAIDPATELPVEFYQVGKQTLAGNPIAREAQAIRDIQKETNQPITFKPYNNLGN